jgi:Holliday junction resolvase RusA-like endonuclease
LLSEELIYTEIKPLSVNDAWKGRRFKTDSYKNYEKELLLILPDIDIPDGDLAIFLQFGFSSSGSDWDNPIKPFVDVLQKKYGFNDSRIHMAVVNKVKVKKGKEYIRWVLSPV